MIATNAVDLHSTMVRFIIDKKQKDKRYNKNLHSTMVRFIIDVFGKNIAVRIRFTFHYG